MNRCKIEVIIINHSTLREAAIASGLIDEAKFDAIVQPAKIISPG
jgi:fumarate hydratase class II